MKCADQFLDAVGIELQRLPSLRMIWCQRTGRVWVSAGMRRRFGIQATHFDELAGWGMCHPEDHERLVEALEALQHAGALPVVLRGVRLLSAPGVYGEFDAAYSRLGCGGVFGALPAPCGVCGVVLVVVRECGPGKWVDSADLIAGVGEPQPEPGEPEPGGLAAAVEAFDLPPVLESCDLPEGVDMPAPKAAAAVRSALDRQWQECAGLLERVRAEEARLEVDVFRRLTARNDPRAFRISPWVETSVPATFACGLVWACLGLFVLALLLALVSTALDSVNEGPPRSEDGVVYWGR